MYHVLLYYKYVIIDNPEEFAKDQRELCKNLNVLGRILIGQEGINGTVAGSLEAITAYKAALQADVRFSDIQFKEDTCDHNPFPKLKVKVRPEIVALNDNEATIDLAGEHLTPMEWHALAQTDDVVILDARNDYEWKIGKFKKAVTPNIGNFREFSTWVKQHKSTFENKKVLMYCTGGIRCERASAVLKNQGIAEVYQLAGGIITYGNEIPDGLWEGSCFVFDDRMAVQVNDDEHHTVISTCQFCDARTDIYYNCCNAECNKLILLCETCRDSSNNACSEVCSQKHRAGVVKHWDIVNRQAQ